MLFVAIALRYVKAMLYGFTALSSRLLGISPNDSNSRVTHFHHRVPYVCLYLYLLCTDLMYLFGISYVYKDVMFKGIL